jgi:predicted nucleotidyltransferase
MADTSARRRIDLAERVDAAARTLGIETAVIGALALAVHGFVRATSDIDLATAVEVYTKLRGLGQTLEEQGLSVELRTPDDDDPLGGVLVVWEQEDEEGDPIEPVEVVNFWNPHRPKVTPAARAIRDALPLDPDSSLRYVRLPDLIALKLYADSRRDHGDIVDLLARNPGADLDEVRARAAPFDKSGILEQLIAEATAR